VRTAPNHNPLVLLGDCGGAVLASGGVLDRLLDQTVRRKYREVASRVGAGPLSLQVDRHDNPLPKGLSLTGYDALFARARDKAGLSAVTGIYDHFKVHI